MKIIRWLDKNFEDLIGAITILLMVIFATLQVVFRYVIKAPLAWTEDYMLFVFVWSTYIASSAAVKYDKHVNVGMFIEKLPKKAQKCMTVFNDFVWEAYNVLLVYCTWPVMQKAIVRNATTVATKTPIWIGYFSIVLCTALMLIRVGQKIVRDIKGINAPDENEKGSEEV